MMSVFSVGGAVLAALVGSIFASTFVAHAVILSRMMALVAAMDPKDSEPGKSLLVDPVVKNGFNKQMGHMTAQLWLALLFYGMGVYLIWGA